ncbi:phospholipase D alpha 1 isoform X2 [Lolium perenne]|uniref:phospholipase D alpha 1 isoform X2 n=1 Tax=Lolium perenne TaxID=4522 RepID=UPI0021F59FA3|nr:phospholipase D alpha 1-like isoform X2 [Lolium perenne]
MAQMLLHGVIEANILEADLSVASGGQLRQPRKTAMKRKVFSWIKKLSFCNSQQLENAIGLGTTTGKLYATVDIDKARVGRTRMLDPTNVPKWGESFHIYCAHDASHVIFTVKANNAVGATLIGRAYLPTGGAVVEGQTVDQWLPICDDKGLPLDGGDKIHVQLRFTDVAADPEARWGAGVGTAGYLGVPRTFYGQRRGCRVRLYQDAHISDGFAPRIQLAGGRPYEPQRCWEDVFEAITNARRMVYIAGWSVNTDVALVRDPRKPSSGTLGELLKRKAASGVTVLMLVWDDRTSLGLGAIRRDGLMATHDEDTATYFRGTGVRCILCPRNPGQGRLSYVQDVETVAMFTHHQKTVIVDGGGGNPAGNASPGLVSFLGGIDLCDGRYDTQEHPLFRTLGTTHRADFHQPNFPGASISKGGPREPWHDIHCRIEGPAAWDVLDNFEQRWRRQGDGDEYLVALDKGWSASEAIQDAESWNVQVFRSIDGGAAAGFPDIPAEASRIGLQTGKDHVIERSIQDAYIHAIRRARDFIYIENQYFLGSSYAWRRDDGVTVEDINALHLIPKELSLKIVSKIEAGERFAVYVVVPMWPEGVPESGSVQAILDWQRRTMEMMYKDVALAIQAKGIQAHPKDYLTFFCLGNREAYTPGEYSPPERPEPDTDYMRAQQARRFMIYVHAKTMIVDDEYVIIGSANINQRSMDGGRDSEIAMGAYQPSYLASSIRPARGQVHGLRLALWQEHLGQAAAAAGASDLLRPSSVACVRRVNQVAQQHWEMYASDVPHDLPGHLMAYPIGVSDGGELQETTPFFPDTKARVFGNRSTYLPPILTT